MRSAKSERMTSFKRPLAVIGFCGFGALVAVALLPFYAGVALTVLCALCGAAMWIFRKTRKAAWCLLAATVALLLFLVCEIRDCRPLQKFDGQTAYVRGTVTESGGIAHRVLTVTVRVTDGDLPRGTLVTLRAPFSDLAPAYGDEVKTTTALEYTDTGGLFRYDKAEKILLSGWTKQEKDFTLLRVGDRSLRARVTAARTALSQAILSGMTRDVRPLLLAMCLGDKSELPADVTAAFRRSGVSHLLVVSGLHLSIVAMGVYGVLRKLRAGRRAASVAALCALWAFAVLVGFHPSVMRACILNTLVFSGNLFRRRADGLNSLGGGLLLLWVCNPFCVYDVGLWLSFSATAGLLCFFPHFTKAYKDVLEAYPLRHRALDRAVRFVLESLCTTLAATLLILPICAVVFGEISLVTPLANLVCVPAATLLLWCSAGALLFSVLPFGFLAGGWRLCATLLARFLLWATSLCGGAPHAVLSTREPYRVVWIFLTLALVAVLWKIYGKRKAAAGFAVALAVLILLCVGDRVWTAGQTEVTLKRAYGDNAALLTQDGVACLFVDGDNGWTAAADLLDRENQSAVETVVIVDAARKLTRKWQEFDDRVTVENYVLAADDKAAGTLKTAEKTVTVTTTAPLFENGRMTVRENAVSVNIDGTQFTLDFTGTDDVSFAVR